MIALQITDSLNWTTSFLESAKERCRDFLYASVMMTAKEYQEFESESCPMRCNDRGSCDNGVCNCTAPYTGYACQDDTSLLPSLITHNQLCDVRMENCSYIKLFGWNLLPENNLRCHFTPMEVCTFPFFKVYFLKGIWAPINVK